MDNVWQELDVETKVCDALREVTEDGHHFGRPYMTAYQLALKVNRAHPEVAAALGVPVGGSGSGGPTLSRYLARQLSGRIKSAPRLYPVEGAFLSNDHVRSLTYDEPGGGTLTSSLTGTGYDLSLFRLRT